MRRSTITVLVALGAVACLAAAVASSEMEQVRINDRCDPATFPPEAGCIGDGNVTFQEFLAKLNPTDGGHHAWRFHREGGHMEAGESFRLVNEGGEPHSFVEVSSFGTGVVPPLNGALPPGTPPAVPVGSYATLDQANVANLVLPKSNRVMGGLAPGMHKFQCLIHPWMRLEVEVRKEHGDR